MSLSLFIRAANISAYNIKDMVTEGLLIYLHVGDKTNLINDHLQSHKTFIQFSKYSPEFKNNQNIK